MLIWSYANVVLTSQTGADKDDGEQRLEDMLLDGWEPFAVTADTFQRRVHLRKSREM